MSLSPRVQNISLLLKRIEQNPNFEIALEIAKELAYLLKGNDEGNFKILNVTRHGDKVSGWFNMVPGVDIPASYQFQMDLPIDFKVYWLQKAGKQRIAGCVNFTENYEDDPSLFFDKNIGVDIIIPDTPSKIFIVLSNAYKLRILELNGSLSVTQQEILQKWIQNFSGLNQKTIHEILWESFNLKSLNQKFYQGIAKRFTEIVQHMTQNGEDESEAKHFVNRLIGRIIFVWFLRKKKIIDESYGYFDTEGIDSAKYYYEKLIPLFFETLNKPTNERNHLDKTTPYLNGGLFEARGIDKKSNLPFLKVFFKDLYEFLFEYNFTTDESTSSFEQLAIDPEMLGRIFENLLAEQVTETGEQARKAKGAFYTPREIVDYMCSTSLKTYLEGALNKEELKETDKEKIIKHLFDDTDAQFALYKKNESYDAITKNRGVIISALDRMTILDPACGSGAFPMGMMQAIIRVYERVLTEAKFDPVEIKLGIIERSIFGVDIEPMAVEISRLRAWLSIIVDEANDLTKVKPLPNLDFKFVCANSLIPLTTNKQGSFGMDLSIEDRMQQIRNEYFKTNSKAKKEKLRSEFESLIGVGQNTFDTSEYTQQLRSYHPFDPENSCDFFDPKFMFGIENGFDIVIGNPPYITYKGKEKVTFKKEFIDKIIKLYKNSAEYKINSYALFIELGLNLIRIGGNVSYIIPSTILQNQYLKNIRKYILFNSHLSIVVGFANKVFEAITDSIILNLEKKVVIDGKVKYIRKSNLDFSKNEEVYYDQDKFKENEDFSIGLKIAKDDDKIIEKIGNNKTLDNFLGVYVGVVAKGMNKFISKDKLNDNHKKFLFGRDLSKYSYKFGGNYINFIKEELHSNTNEEIYLKNEKLLVRKTGNVLMCAYDSNKFYTDQSIYNLYLKDGVHDISLKYIMSLLNSTLLNYYFNKKMITNADIFPYIKGIHLKQLPIKEVINSKQKLFIDLIDQIIKITGLLNYSDSKELKENIFHISKEIDKYVYKLYDLTFEEVLIVDPEFSLTKDEYEKLTF